MVWRGLADGHGKRVFLMPGPGPGLPSAVAKVMVKTSSTRPAGGEYGDVRTSIDVVKLNAYLANSVPAATVPVSIKQFKVRPFDCFATAKDYCKPSRPTVWSG